LGKWFCSDECAEKDLDIVRMMKEQELAARMDEESEEVEIDL